MKNDNLRARMQIIFGALIFTLVMAAELYTMINYSDQFVVIIVLGVVNLLFLYVVISGILQLMEKKNARREEQYESIFKSEKASYLMLRKYFEEIEQKLERFEKETKISNQEVVNAQKGVAKVIINRNHEHAQAMLRSNEELAGVLNKVQVQLEDSATKATENKQEIIDAQKNAESERVDKLQAEIESVKAALDTLQQHLEDVVKESLEKQQVQAAPEPEMEPVLEEVGLEPEAEIEPILEDVGLEPEPEIEPIIEDVGLEPEAEIEPFMEDIELEPEPEIEPIIEDVESEPEADVEPILEDIGLEPEPEIEPIIEDVESEPEAEVEPILEDIGLEPEPEIEPIIEDAELESEAEIEMPDLSDPNKTLDEDEVAALFASMEADLAAEPEPEPVPEPVEDSGDLDLSDPNKQMSPDDIAKLLAQMGN